MQPSESAPSEAEVEKTEPVSHTWCFDSVFAQDYELGILIHKELSLVDSCIFNWTSIYLGT